MICAVLVDAIAELEEGRALAPLVEAPGTIRRAAVDHVSVTPSGKHANVELSLAVAKPAPVPKPPAKSALLQRGMQNVEVRTRDGHGEVRITGSEWVGVEKGDRSWPADGVVQIKSVDPVCMGTVKLEGRAWFLNPEAPGTHSSTHVTMYAAPSDCRCVLQVAVPQLRRHRKLRLWSAPRVRRCFYATM